MCALSRLLAPANPRLECALLRSTSIGSIALAGLGCETRACALVGPPLEREGRGYARPAGPSHRLADRSAGVGCTAGCLLNARKGGRGVTRRIAPLLLRFKLDGRQVQQIGLAWAGRAQQWLRQGLAAWQRLAYSPAPRLGPRACPRAPLTSPSPPPAHPQRPHVVWGQGWRRLRLCGDSTEGGRQLSRQLHGHSLVSSPFTYPLAATPSSASSPRPGLGPPGR